MDKAKKQKPTEKKGGKFAEVFVFGALVVVAFFQIRKEKKKGANK